MIRELVFEDYSAASVLLWKSFYPAERGVCTMEGMELFRNATDPVSLSMSAFSGKIRYFGVFENNCLVGVGAIKGENHVLLLYIHPDFWNLGFGSKMLAFLESRCNGDCITVNASDFALSFYKKMGYMPIGPREEKAGLVTTPMKKILQNA